MNFKCLIIAFLMFTLAKFTRILAHIFINYHATRAWSLTHFDLGKKLDFINESPKMNVILYIKNKSTKPFIVCLTAIYEIFTFLIKMRTLVY